MEHQPMRASALAATLLLSALSAAAAEEEVKSGAAAMTSPSQIDAAEAAAKKALDAFDIKLWGYMRSGAYSSKDGVPKGHISLGGDLGGYRLGNEGDNYLEFGIGKKWELDGAKAGAYWMPTVYNGSADTAQIYADVSGLAFAPHLSFWGGQRYHRVQDVHIIDNWLMEDGDNYGAGVDGIKLGSMGGSLNIAAYTEGSSGNKNAETNHGKRVNLQWLDLPIGPAGKLSLTAAYVRGSFADRRNSGALGALYEQKFGVLKNSLFVQGSNGHADLRGKFYNLDGTNTTTTSVIDTNNPTAPGVFPVLTTTTTTPTSKAGARQFRVVDAINWQRGPLGGQALVGYQTLDPDDTHVKTKDFSIGGRLSYGIARNVKLYGEGGFTVRKIQGSETQHLHKETVAVALAPNTDFWTRPEIRLYLTHLGWNDAAAAANIAGFGANGRNAATLFGVQVEAWW